MINVCSVFLLLFGIFVVVIGAEYKHGGSDCFPHEFLNIAWRPKVKIGPLIFHNAYASIFSFFVIPFLQSVNAGDIVSAVNAIVFNTFK